MQARTKVTLRIRIRTKGNNRVYATPAYSNNNKLRPLWALVDGIAEHHPEGKYQLRYRRNGRRVWEDVGSDADVAFTAKLRREHMQQSQALGLSPPDTVATKRIPLKDGAAEYLEDIAGRRAPKTFQAYALALHYFQESCSKTYLDQIERTDLLQFMRFLPRTHGLSPRTVFNQVRDIVSFLRNFKVCGLIAGTDMPRYTEKKVSAYTRAELQCLFRASTAQEAFAFQFFLGTGGRDQEVSFSGYDDVNFETKTIHFRKQADVGFDLKDHEERFVPLPEELLSAILARQLEHPGQRFVFESTKGKPERHLLRILKRAALRAGLNCGHCKARHNGNDVSCASYPVCKRWELHRFRKTFATMHHENGVSARTLQAWLGHESLETTLAYLEAADNCSERTRGQVNSTFKSLVMGAK